MEQATYRQLLDTLDAAAAERGWRRASGARDGQQRQAPGNIGTLVRHVYERDDGTDYVVCVCVPAWEPGAGSLDALEAFMVPLGQLEWDDAEAGMWARVCNTLSARGLCATLTPDTLALVYLEALMVAAVHAEDACREMVRRARELADVPHAHNMGKQQTHLD